MKKDNLPTPTDVAIALRDMHDDTDGWLTVQTPLTDKPFPLLCSGAKSLTHEQFIDLSDCYMYALRHGWASWEAKHGLTPTRPTGDQVAIMPYDQAIRAIFNFQISGFTEAPPPPRYWEYRLADKAWTRPLDLAGIYITAFRHGWFLRSEEDAKKNGQK